jgi:hypothetical protein
MLEREQKSIRNQICGVNKCNKPATKLIIFPLGFSAKFCNECADFLIKKGMGKRKA